MKYQKLALSVLFSIFLTNLYAGDTTVTMYYNSETTSSINNYTSSTCFGSSSFSPSDLPNEKTYTFNDSLLPEKRTYPDTISSSHIRTYCGTTNLNLSCLQFSNVTVIRVDQKWYDDGWDKHEVRYEYFVDGISAPIYVTATGRSEYLACPYCEVGYYTATRSLFQVTLRTYETVDTCRSFTWKGVTYSEDVYLYDTLTTAQGCDSIHRIELNYNPIKTYETLNTCVSYTWKGVTYTSNTYLYDTLTTTQGCDSIHRIELNYNPIQTAQTVDTCRSYTWKGATYTSNTVLYDTTKTAEGCDSIHKVILYSSVMEKASSEIDCSGQYTLDGITYTSDTVFSNTHKTPNGCDSVHTTTINIINEFNGNENENFDTQNSCGKCYESCDINSSWVNVSGDDLDWLVGSDLNGKYIYLESRVGGCYNSTSVLSYYCGLNLTDYSQASIQFKYYLTYPTNPTDLKLIAEGTSGGKTAVFTGSTEGSWSIANVDLSAYAGQVVQLQFEGHTGYNKALDVGLDDIEISGTKLITGIDNLAENSFSIYPNPTSDVISIQTSQNAQVTSIQISGMDGSTAYQSNKLTGAVDVSTLAPGIYIIQVTFTDGSVASKRLVKL